MRSRRILAPSIVLTIVALLAALAPPTFAADISESKGFRKAVTLAGVREHQAALQEIADDNADTRSSGTPGYRESADSRRRRSSGCRRSRSRTRKVRRPTTRR